MKPRLLTVQVHCATSVVGICSHHFADKMIEKLIMYLTRLGKNTLLYLYPHMGHRLKCLPKFTFILNKALLLNAVYPFLHSSFAYHKLKRHHVISGGPRE